MSKSQKLMTSGSIWKQMLMFAIPICIGNLFQQLYNTADSLIVGNYLGSQALAAVASSGNLIFMMTGFVSGMAMGAGILIARYFGAGKKEEVQEIVHTSIALAIAIGIVVTVAGVGLTPFILRWMSTPESVMDQSMLYFAVYFSGSIWVVLYNFLSEIMRAVGNSKSPLYYLAISSVVNIVLDIVFIAYLGMGVEGAGWATVISQFLSAGLSIFEMLRTDAIYKIHFKKIKLHMNYVHEILHYGLPTGVQNSIISISNVIIQSHINSFGDMAMAGCGVFVKIEGFVFLPIMAFNMAISTFVSQNMGAKQEQRAKKGAMFGIVCSMLLAEAIGILFFMYAPSWIGLFDQNPRVIAYGAQRAKVDSLFFFLLAYSHATSSVIRGVGKPKVPMYVMMFCWCMVRVVVLGCVMPFYHEIMFVNWIYPFTWFLSSAFFVYYYHWRLWKNEKFL